MTIATIAPYLALVLTALSISNIIWTWLRTRDQGNAAEKAAVAQRITDIGSRVDRHENRIQSVEQTLRTLPAKDDMHELQLAMERLRGYGSSRDQRDPSPLVPTADRTMPAKISTKPASRRGVSVS